MAGGVMNQVTGLIPGMKKEEEVPDVAPQEGEYQEYTVGIQQDLHSNGILLLMYFSILHYSQSILFISMINCTQSVPKIKFNTITKCRNFGFERYIMRHHVKY